MKLSEITKDQFKTGLTNPNLLNMERLGNAVREYAKPWGWSVDWEQDMDGNVLQLDLFTLHIETGYHIDSSREAKELRSDLIRMIHEKADELGLNADIYSGSIESRADNHILEYSIDFL